MNFTINTKEKALISNEREPLKIELERSFERHNLRGLSNDKLGATLRALLPLKKVFMDALREKQRPDHPWLINPLIAINASSERRAEVEPEIERLKKRYRENMEYFERERDKNLIEIIELSLGDPERGGYPIASVIFEDDAPVLYENYWYTDDLDDSDADYCELQTYVALNGFGTQIGEQAVIQNYIGQILHGEKISRAPNDFVTYGTISDEIFEPFLR